MLTAVLLFVVGLIFLIKGGDWFVEGASNIAKKFNMPELLIGATVVSIGTTLPEVMVSASSAVTGHGEIAYGNAIGSIICNTSLIAAITIAFAPSKVERKSLITPVFFFFLSAAFYSAIAYTTGDFSRLTGIMLLILFAIYMFVTIRQAFKDKGENHAEENAIKETVEQKKGFLESKKDVLWVQIVLLVIGAALIAVGANLLVENGTIIAQTLGVPESVIAVTVVALGTSLPELVTAVTSLVKGCGALSLGNVIGANLFNIVLVCGASCTLSPFKVPSGKLVAGIPSSLLIEIPLMLFVMAFMTIPAIIKGRLARYQGIALLVVYAAFCVVQFV